MRAGTLFQFAFSTRSAEALNVIRPAVAGADLLSKGKYCIMKVT